MTKTMTTTNPFHLKTTTSHEHEVVEQQQEQQQERQPLLSPRNDKLRSNFRNKIHMRRASLTDGEAAFLLGLLIDPAPLPSPQEQQDGPLGQSSSNSAEDDDDTDHISDSMRTDAAVRVQEERMEKAVKVLDDEMLFSIPPGGFGIDGISPSKLEEAAAAGDVRLRRSHQSRASLVSARSGGRQSYGSTADGVAGGGDADERDHKRKLKRQSSKYTKRRSSIFKKPEQYKFLVGLWQAFEDGVTVDKLLGFHNKQKEKEKLRAQEEIEDATAEVQRQELEGLIQAPSGETGECADDAATGKSTELVKHGKQPTPSKEDEKKEVDGGEPPLPTEVTAIVVAVDDADDNDSINSDEEVRRDRLSKLDSYMSSDDSSWDEEDGGFDHFDTWQVLKDEYAIDGGFDYKPDYSRPSSMDDEDDTAELDQHRFHILGTSAEDVAAHPHVLSPPLMDSLLNFVPDTIAYGHQNWWLKYSLVRDGASLETMKRYVRASQYTIIAIETTKGHVFGSFTSTPWRTQHGFYGGEPSFVWRMRHSRNSPCHSLLDQAQLESEIDVHFLLKKENMVQCSPHDMLGVGEGNVLAYDEYGRVVEEREGDDEEDDRTFGFAISLEDDLLAGTSSRCSSYKNPCLIDPTKENGQAFDVLNLEVWTFTPCMTVDAAEKLEMSQFFIQESIRSTIGSFTGSPLMNDRSNNTYSSASGEEFGNQAKFFRRVGHEDSNEANRERWHYRNMMDGGNTASTGRAGVGGSTSGIGGHTPRFG